jgi:hypothetical protein
MANLIASVAAAIANDRQIETRFLAAVHGPSAEFLEDLGLVKKSARWVPKMLPDWQKEERVLICN